jgi:bla regulator protein BlaR1
MTESLLQIAIALDASTALSIVVKASLALGLALLAVRFARRGRASTRHLILASTFAALVALPLTAVFAPPITVAVPRPPVASPVMASPTGLTDAPAQVGLATNRDAGVTPIGRSPLSPSARLGLAWAIGVLLFLVPVTVTPWRLRQLRRAARPWPDADTVVRPLAAAAGIGRPVALLVHDGVTSPLTCGSLRPVIVLPADALRWDEDELQQALTHELEHIRRADWAVHVATRIVCALYWFHPLVWCVWRRLGLEAERACDDSVLRVADRTAYAEQLVLLARRRARHSTVAALSMAGGSDLSARVLALLDETQGRGPLRAPVACAVVAVAGALVAAVAPLRASMPVGVQAGDAAPKRPAFAVVSIRKNTSGTDGPFSFRLLPGGRIVGVNQTVRRLIMFAHVLRPQQLAGGPDWLDRDRFDIVAQAETEIPPSPPGGPAGPAMLMMQQLLADRFNLVMHTEKRELPIYALTLARGAGQLGPRIRPAQTDCATVMAAILKSAAPGGGPPVPPRLADGRPACGATQSTGRMLAGGTTLTMLADNLSGQVGRIVEDRTGLTGAFDFDLEFAPESAGPPAAGAANDAAQTSSDRPSLFTALEEQLGLRLQPLRAPVDVLVIDRLDPPTEN